MSDLAATNFGVRSVEILGVRVDDVTLDEAIEFCRVARARGGSARVFTPNAEIVMAARHDPSFRALLNQGTLNIPDGAGLLLAGRLRGTRLREQVAGTDLAERLAETAAREGWRLFLLGAMPGVAEAAAARLKERYPDLSIARTAPGSPDPRADAQTRDLIQAAGPVDLILVAYGAPKQERWIARNQEALGIPLAVGVGGVFDFWSGRVPRAPRLLRRAGLDWLFRLIVQPWRWRRQLALPRFVIAVGVEALERRFGRPR